MCGKWPDTGVWVCLLTLSDKFGHVDVSPRYISSVTGIPEADLLECIARFMAPDSESRTTNDDGRRLELLDPSRPWGWKIINFQKYRDRARKKAWDAERTASGKDAERKRQQRGQSESVPTCPDAARPSPLSDTNTTPTPVVSAAKRPTDEEFQRFKATYPKRAGGQRWQDARKGIRARLSEGHTFDEILDGARRYSAYCTRTDKTGTDFVMQATRFCGPNKEFEEEWKSEPGPAAPESTADVADRLGLKRGADESDEQFERRVGDAMTAKMYSNRRAKS